MFFCLAGPQPCIEVGLLGLFKGIIKRVRRTPSSLGGLRHFKLPRAVVHRILLHGALFLAQLVVVLAGVGIRGALMNCVCVAVLMLVLASEVYGLQVLERTFIRRSKLLFFHVVA